MKIYNSLSREKEEFVPIKKGKVGIYTCGPTVYSYAHIGNLKLFIFADTLKRIFLYNDFNVKHIMNITDVGHLTGDGDDGEDKVELTSAKEGKTAKEITQFYFEDFKKNFLALNLIEPDIWSKVTEHIKEQIDFIKKLEKKGYTYKTQDGIYFDTSKFSDYGKLSGKKAEDLEAGKRVSMKEKKNSTDFALWKFSSKGSKRQQEWESPWGIGFPGWHIECSAMATKYLGEQFDIHTGGEDLLHIHHENEIAQSECALGVKPWVKYWMHVAFLTQGEDVKMSKSGGGMITLSDLILKGFTPMHYKYFVFTAHYHKPLAFGYEALESAKNSYEKIKNILREIKDDGKINLEYLKEFDDAVSDDIDMPRAIAVLWKMLRDTKAKGKYRAVQRMDEVFGLKFLELDEEKAPGDIVELAIKRDNARKTKDWEGSDKIRKELELRGWKIEDSKNGYVLRKI